jgi:hypothetical protein
MEGFTTRMFGPVAISETGTKSRSESNGTFVSSGFTVTGPRLPITKV